MDIQKQTQRNPVGDEVSALVAVVRPILVGLLFGLKGEVVAEAGGRDAVKLMMLPRLYRPGDGDCGICFEFAVHDAMLRREPMVMERVDEALRLCRVDGGEIASILFAAEKTGSEQLINTARDLVTPNSVLMYGTRGRPANLKRHIDAISQAFRKRGARADLPTSISGVWKSDLILGKTDTDRWVGTSVKINSDALEGARGLRVGVVPVKQGETDAPYKDEARNLVVCPLLHDANFMQLFYEGWIIVQQVVAADMQMPREVAVPRPPARQVARLLVERREFSLLEVVDALEPLAQPELLDTTNSRADVVLTRGDTIEVQSVLAPEARTF